MPDQAPAVDSSSCQKCVRKLIGTFTMIVVTSAMPQSTAARTGRVAPPRSTAPEISSTSEAVMSTGMIRPKVFTSPFSAITWFCRSSWRSTGCTNA